MRIAIALLLALTACSDDSGATPDGGVDGGIDGPPGAVDGEWSLMWTCNNGCVDPIPALTRSRRLVVDGLVLSYFDAAGNLIERHDGTADGLCGEVYAQTSGAMRRDTYRLCRIGDVTEATFRWPNGVTWRMFGAL